MTLVHLVDMDSHRHRYGVRSAEAQGAWRRLDKRVAQIMQAVKDAGNFERTNFAILGDHYQINVHSMIHLNVLFAQHGWVHPLAGKTVYRPDWQVTAKTCDGETYVYTRGEVNLKELKKMIEAVDGVKHVYTAKEAAERGADPRCTFLVEAVPGYYFTDEVNRPAIVERVDPSSLGTHDRYRGVHGYGPDQEGYFTTIMFTGPDVRKQTQIDHAKLVDEGPTFAKLLGLTYPQPTAGQAIDVLK